LRFCVFVPLRQFSAPRSLRPQGGAPVHTMDGKESCCILFDGKSVEGLGNQEDDEYDEVRAKLRARLAVARILILVDIGFGDAVYPEPSFAAFLAMYATGGVGLFPRGIHPGKAARDGRNGRMKAFYFIWLLRTPGIWNKDYCIAQLRSLLSGAGWPFLAMWYSLRPKNS
jgi:hypothetical protein